MSTEKPQPESALARPWYNTRVPRPLGWILYGILFVFLALIAFGRVGYWWATAGVRAAGATVAGPDKGGYRITLATGGKAASVLNSDISRLNSLGSPVSLGLNGTDASDEVLVHLESLNQLVDLGLANTRITDAGTPQLAKLHGIWGLNLAGTRVTDAGVSKLAELRHLYQLDLARTQVTDNCLFPNSLGFLNLRNTNITDAVLPRLAELKRLYYLNLEGTKVTEDGLKAIRQALPSYCNIRK
jgi:hypothetical protein